MKRKKEKIKLKVSYEFVGNNVQLEAGFRILSKNFYENQEKIKEKFKNYEKHRKQSTVQSR